MELRLPKQIRGYTLLRKLGGGGMAEVYLAIHTGAYGFEMPCVLKRIRPELQLEPKFRERFLREARIAAALRHPNIVKVFDLIEDDDRELYLAMEHIEGAPLSELRAKLPGRLLPSWAAARVGWCIARALDCTHHSALSDSEEPGAIHRDVSPQNILVSRRGEVKLIDFGIAKPTHSALSTGLMGKVAYLAPEQARGDAVDARTDVFALGVTLFELVTGSRPYPGSDDLQLLEELKTGSSKAPLASDFEASVPEALAEIIDTGLQRAPGRRYPTARGMADALESFIRGEPTRGPSELEELVAIALGPLPDLPPRTDFGERSPGDRTPALVPVSEVSQPVPLMPTAVIATEPRSRSRTGLVSAAALAALLGVGAMAVSTGTRAVGHETATTAQVPPTIIAPTPPLTLPAAPGLERKAVTAASSPLAPLVHAPALRGSAPVRFKAIPFASLTVDGKPTADADPFVEVVLPTGKHRAIFTYLGEPKSVEFTVSADQPQQVDAVFAPR